MRRVSGPTPGQLGKSARRRRGVGPGPSVLPEALDLMTKTQDEASKAVLFSDLGLIARETGEFNEAIAYARSRWS